MTPRAHALFGANPTLVAALAATLLAAACSDDTKVETTEMRGERVYRNVCATCHGSNPNRDGVTGPAIADASEELLRARVLRGEYPPGYTPKRNTRQMVALPYLEPVIPDLSAYLASVER
ncbi:MAG: cytochrome c [Deltaproteobacteria bacterium]|nr:cytochrome c [Deltaproteobacteria bacterium]MBW2359942.1 cytochrome c [Deltaproteobacteria bacterium]